MERCAHARELCVVDTMDVGSLLQAAALRQSGVPDLTSEVLRLSLKAQYRRGIQPSFRLRADLDGPPLIGEIEENVSVISERLYRLCRRSCHRRLQKRMNGRTGRLGR